MGVRTILAAVASVALLAGCGGSDTGYTSARAVADAAGCGQVKASTETTLFATDEVSCRHAGHFVLVDWFKDDGSLARFKQASNGSGYRILYGHDWAVSCVDSKADCAVMQGRVGGSLS